MNRRGGSSRIQGYSPFFKTLPVGSMAYSRKASLLLPPRSIMLENENTILRLVASRKRLPCQKARLILWVYGARRAMVCPPAPYGGR